MRATSGGSFRCRTKTVRQVPPPMLQLRAALRDSPVLAAAAIATGTAFQHYDRLAAAFDADSSPPRQPPIRTTVLLIHRAAPSRGLEVDVDSTEQESGSACRRVAASASVT